MPKVTYIDHNENPIVVDAQVGTTVMQAALDNDIEGIVAECGGSMACCTCHCIVDDAWVEKTGTADDDEKMMLEMIEMQPASRLSCQIKITEELDGLIVHLPEEQGF